ncbi:DgyrCDS6794 [Dimorphilus gyrociliatus]|uniref:DgyrCDS6794 n=1 Tax=Dimorphilus gyrociliatus TaxID=2664684 RepID=A0A7I8VTW7_9ANNE|nr:DgyrCDS6794 [Dimorphilus gyrociliatus]
MIPLTINEKTASAAVLLTAELVKDKCSLEVKEGENTELCVSDSTFSSTNSIIRYLARVCEDPKLYGSTPIESAEVDNYLEYAHELLENKCTDEILKTLNSRLASRAFLVGRSTTIADCAIWDALTRNLSLTTGFPNVSKYLKMMIKKKVFSNIASKKNITLPGAANNEGAKKERKGEEGKFVPLPGAKKGEVVVRFPPEASGYLHIGHAKAALLNQYYQISFEGKLIMRFDDTNPAKESSEFEQVILEDLKLLGIKPDVFTHTSDHFDLISDFCVKMMKEGKAYADDTEPEEMKKQRETRTESKNRTNSLEKNLSMWEEMKKGSSYGKTCCIRAKIDMQSNNGCLRDPTMYRCKEEAHVRTGTKYKVYPTYDFACPIVDSVEGVTHALRTTEYRDRDAQYEWFLNAMKIRKPIVYEYARLNLQNIVMSKRKLTWFVEEGIVEGWNDPRFPTVRGVLRRGMTVEGLKQFVIAQGSTKSVNFMEWDKIWAFNKKVIDPIVPRYTALLKDDLIKVNINGVTENEAVVDAHPKNKEAGTKTVFRTKTVLIEQEDALRFKENENVTFVNWGNVMIKSIKKSGDRIVSVDGDLNLEDTNYKKTIKITWLPQTEKEEIIPITAHHYDHLITKGVLDKNDDFKNFINRNSKKEIHFLGESMIGKLKKGDIIQVQRKGYYIVDVPYEPMSRHSSRCQPAVLILVPEGNQEKQEGQIGSKKVKESKGGKSKEANQEKKQAATSSSGNAVDLNEKISSQGNKIRDLKSKKADKGTIDAEVKILLALKAEYKSATGSDWKPGAAPPKAASASAASTGGDASALNDKITEQGNKIRDLKSKKADKGTIDAEVKTLLALKAEYKSATGSDWKPGAAPPKAAASAAPTGGNASALNDKITEQGNKIRDLKSKKADKGTIDTEVKTLLALKAEYKSATGSDWKPGAAPPKAASASAASTGGDASALNDKITEQGNKIRDLKSKKADKGTIDAEVKTLLALKAEYKSATGSDWKPGAAPPKAAASAAPTGGNASALNDKITEQGNKIRDLKSKKADKGTIDAEVKTLLALKAEYKSATGSDWKPGAAPPKAAASAAPTGGNASALNDKITEQGNKIRDLKSKKADKGTIDTEVKTLLALKAEYKSVTGNDWKPPAQSSCGNKPQKKEIRKESEKKAATGAGESGGKKVTRLGLEVEKDDLSEWYSQVITKSEMIEYYDVSGCYILRPWAFGIWESIQASFDTSIKKLGVENCYFPMFVSNAALQKEKDHIADFSPEVAWVTKCGSSEMAEPVAIRPTSETVMYPSYSRWVQSHRDLPIKLNQWCNVVRWEFKHPQPFLRTREFLWQEGHTAYANKEDAVKEVYQILELYAGIYEDLLAIPVVRGRKTEKEKFAGGDFTTTVEAYVPASGRAIQGATSHHLGQNFSKMFNISFEDPVTGEKQFAYQNSWGLTTRTIGVLVMVHGDNKGLVLPPRLAKYQAVIIPCGVTASLKPAEKKDLYDTCSKLTDQLNASGIRTKCDLRENYSPGWKFNNWELKGVPLRIEIGPRDMKNNEIVVVRRDNSIKATVSNNGVEKSLASLLETIQKDMFSKAFKEMWNNITTTKSFDEFCSMLDRKKLIMSPFCGEIDCEDTIKKLSAREAVVEEGAPAMGAKGLCIPQQQPAEFIEDGKLSPGMFERLFNGLNSFYAGIPEDFLKLFTKYNYYLNEVRFSDENMQSKESLKILKQIHIQNLNIESLKLVTLEELMDYVNEDELKGLSIHGCRFLPDKKLVEQVEGQAGISYPEFLKDYPSLKNLTKLNVQYTCMKNIQFFFITKEIRSLTDVNISGTFISDIRLLKKQTNLQYLNCSDLKSSAKKHFIHLHCLKKLERLRFGNWSMYKRGGRISWSNEINLQIAKFLTREEKVEYIAVPERFRSKHSWDISEFLTLAGWKNLKFFDLVGDWEPSSSSVLKFITNHSKLKYFGIPSTLDSVSINSDIRRNISDYGDIRRYERIHGRNEMSLLILYDEEGHPVHNCELRDAYDANAFVFDNYGNIAIPDLEKFKNNYSSEKNLELCEQLAEELLFEKYIYFGSKLIFGEACLKILCLDIMKSEHFLTIIELIAETYLHRYNYLTEPIDFLFIVVLEKYNSYFKMVSNVSLIYRRIFTAPESYGTFQSYYSLIYYLTSFLSQLDFAKISKEELVGLCGGMKRIQFWKRIDQCEKLYKRFYIILINILNACKERFGWNMRNLPKYFDPLIRKSSDRYFNQRLHQQIAKYNNYDEHEFDEESPSESEDSIDFLLNLF